MDARLEAEFHPWHLAESATICADDLTATEPPGGPTVLKTIFDLPTAGCRKTAPNFPETPV